MANLTDDRRARLEDLAAASRDAQHTAKIARERLGTAVLESIDADKVSPSVVARAIGVSPSRIYQIITAAYRN